MPQFYTTFRLARKDGACGQDGSTEGYGLLAKTLGGVESYGEDTPISFEQILDSNGLNDALWALGAVHEELYVEQTRFARLLACDYAEHVLRIYEDRYPGDSRPRRAIEVARLFAKGQATEEQLRAACYAASAAASAAYAASAFASCAAADAAADAADAAAAYFASYAAAYALSADDEATERDWQLRRFREALKTYKG